MIGSDEVNFGEDGTAGQCCGEILYVRHGVTVRYGTTIQCSVVSTRTPVSRCLLGDHVERQCPVAGGGLYDPQVQRRRSGPNCRARAETGGPLVSMWCVMLCLIGIYISCAWLCDRGKLC